jgi:hypothetical protein
MLFVLHWGIILREKRIAKLTLAMPTARTNRASDAGFEGAILLAISVASSILN